MKVPNALTRDDTEHGATYYLASEVDALLQERDAEIEIANALLKARLENSATEVQRKVLETALNVFIDITTHINMKRFWRDKDGIRFDEITDAAITAIQEALSK